MATPTLLRALLALPLFFLAACAPPVSRSETEERDDVLYLVGSEEPFTGTVVDAFPDTLQGVAEGVVAVRTEYRKGRPHGLTTGFYPTGEKRFEAEARDGVRLGEGVEWYPSGAVKRVTPYTDGRMEGTLREYGEEGTLVLERELRDGMANGPTRRWFPSGAPEDSAGYVDDALEGRVKRWFESGQLRLDQEFKAGYPHGRYREWNEAGTLIGEGTYAYGEIHGTYRRWHDEGSPALEGEYFRGRSFALRMWDETGDPIAIRPDMQPNDTLR